MEGLLFKHTSSRENCFLGKVNLHDVQKGEFLQHYDNSDVDDVMVSKDEDDNEGALHGPLMQLKMKTP